MSKAPRWPETLINSKTNTPAQKTRGKEPAAIPVPAPSRGKHAGSQTSKPSAGCGRSNSLSSRGSDSTASGSKAGGSWKRGSLGHQGHQGTRPASRPARPALRLCSSRSFSSLHTSSLTAASFMRSSRSLNRLDQRPTGDGPSSQVKKQTTEEKELNSGHLSSSQKQIRDKEDRCHDDEAEKMKTSSLCEPPESSSSLVSTTAQHHQCNKVKQQTRDGVYTLCAMTSGMRHNWVQAVLKNVRPGLTPDVTSSISQYLDLQSNEDLGKAEHPNSFLQEHETSDCAEETHQQQKEEELEPETEQRSADGCSASSTIASPDPSPISPPRQEEDVGASSLQCSLDGTTLTGVTDASSCLDGAGDSSTSTARLSDVECFNEHSDMLSKTEQSWQQVKTTTRSDEPQVLINVPRECTKDNAQLPFEQHTGQLVKELNRNLQDELQQERAMPSRERVPPQNDLPSNSNSEQAWALQQLQKINNDLRFELEAKTKNQEKAREVELRQRVDLLAQQAQLLVTGDATALAQAHLEQDRLHFHEKQKEWERCVASLKSQLSSSEEKRKEAEACFTQLQQELQHYHSLQQEADHLHKHLQEVTTELHANQEAQAQKEVRLQKHLTLLQESQDRERRSLASSLAQAEQHSQDLQERLDRAEQQVEGLNKTPTWTRDIEEAQQQLQEELACTISAVQKLQEEREQLDHRCQELQNQLCEADGEMSRLQSRLQTEETHYYNLEHSYERVSEDLQLALGKVQQKEYEMQDIREGYERLLDSKEQELSEVLLKMEVLGNSLEETEVKLNDVLKGCTCQQKDESSEPSQLNERQSTDLVTGSDSRPKKINNVQLYNSSNAGHLAGDDPERFMSVIQILETKLHVTEEKLRDIMQRLQEHHSDIRCQDPHLCSQLTRSRASAQHLSLLLHSQAKQSQRFAQETENHCKMLVGRFHFALNIIQACRERLQVTPIHITDFEKQLATVAACLQQGEKEAEKQQHESHNASKVEDKILNDETAGAESSISALRPEHDVESVGKYLKRELFVVEKMVFVLQSRRAIGQQSLAPREDEGDLAHKYKSIITRRMALKTVKRTHSGRAECDNGGCLERAIGEACTEAELIYAALKCQQQHESVTQVNNEEMEVQKKSLADINPPELGSYEEQVQGDDKDSKRAAKPVEKEESDVQKVVAETKPELMERLISRLKRRAKFLQQLCQEVSDGNAGEYSVDDDWENASAADLNWMQEQAKLIYLSDRLHLDLELQQSAVLQDKLQAMCEEQDITLKDKQDVFNHTLCQLQENNSVLRGELECAEQKLMSVETGNQRLREDIRKINDYHEERMKNMETEFQKKIRELQQIHEEEMQHLHGFYTKTYKEKQTKTCTESTSSLPDQTEMERNLMLADGAGHLREAYHKDLGKLQASSDQDFAAMEEMHRQLISDLQQQHRTEVATLLKERDKLLQEETAATMAAIVAMRRAHKQELEKSRQSQHMKESADITQLHNEYEKEIRLMHKELEVLSVQHTQKCLENSQLSQELQAERQSMLQYQREDQERTNKQRETDEMSQLDFSRNGKQSHVAPQIHDFYEMEVILRAREAEMQFLRQEAHSLQEDLKIARMDKLYAENQLKALYHSQDESHPDVNKLLEDAKFATWSQSVDASGQTHENTVTKTRNAAFLKKTVKSTLTRQIRGVRSKSLKDGLSVQERMKLFESF
ncbi:early endosome antigen 1 [Clinocottus analis]|uniref:early endosome antigen 1 n=1 Tax=Clinocottus analis TaxID=304258 RepID=UPI0035C11BE9